MDCEIEALKSILGNAIYRTGDDSIQSIIPKLLKNGETLSIAESCTGGLLSSLITSVPGSSTYYKGSVTSYSNEIKERVLGVQREILDNYGAVSKECVEAMAIGVLKLMDTDYSIATSGIAGPGGATTNKPVGLCWMAVAHRNRTTGIISVETHSINCASNREINIQRFASNALNYLRILLLHLS
jgi:nicotinamide-nucleotide amidase